VVVFCVVLAYFSSAVRSGKVEGKYTKAVFLPLSCTLLYAGPDWRYSGKIPVKIWVESVA
jgi:hypothetical protein